MKYIEPIVYNIFKILTGLMCLLLMRAVHPMLFVVGCLAIAFYAVLRFVQLFTQPRR